jgi:hypothetical protein
VYALQLATQLNCTCATIAGRWQAVHVAVKIIKHSERAAINIAREIMLALHMAHPNIVS